MFNVKLSLSKQQKGLRMGKLKMLQVTEETHIKAKKQALAKGMSLKAYIKMLVDKDK